MSDWLRIALEPAVVRRALKYALIVGTILIFINHYGAIWNGDLAADRLLSMGLTIVVPYLVSTFSSVGAIRALRHERDKSTPCD